jgi:cell division protein FtsQ
MRRLRSKKPAAPMPRVTPRRKQPSKPPFERATVRVGAATAVLALLALGGWQFWEAGWIQQGADRAAERVIQMTARLGFAIERIDVNGRHETPADDLRKALQASQGMPIFAFDPAAAQARVKALPWVRSAIVERRLPDTITLVIVERRPIALWQKDGEFSLIDTEGAVIPIDDVGRYGQLPVVVGAGAPPSAAHLIEMIDSEPKLQGRVRAAVRVGERRWDIHFDNGVVARLPEEEPAAAWHRLGELAQDDKLLDRKFSVIDLRLKDRVILRPGGPDDANDPNARST